MLTNNNGQPNINTKIHYPSKSINTLAVKGYSVLIFYLPIKTELTIWKQAKS